MTKKLTKELIKKFQKKLEEDKEEIKLQIQELEKDDPFSDPDHASDNAAIDTDVREQVGHDTIEAQIKDLKKKAEEVGIALEKISKRRYGFCEKCGMQIPIPRLSLIPEARYCIDDEKKLFK